MPTVERPESPRPTPSGGGAGRPRSARRWLFPEGRRAWISAAVGAALGVVLRVASVPRTTNPLLLDDFLVIMAGYELTYVVLTLVALHRTSADDADRAVGAMPPGSWTRRWVTFTDPGVGAALSVGLLAMTAAVVVLPQAATLESRYSSGVLVALSVTLIAGAWATMVLTYAVDYMRRDRRSGGLEFPGTEPPAFADYLYFALSVGTTFGTTDVTITSTDVRRTVTGQALVAFVFNTVIIALSVGSIAGLAAG